jgi:hypothetical protein
MKKIGKFENFSLSAIRNPWYNPWRFRSEVVAFFAVHITDEPFVSVSLLEI